MDEAEWQTRKERIDVKPRSLNPPWRIVPWTHGLDTSTLACHAVTEFPTKNGLSKRKDLGETGSFRKFHLGDNKEHRYKLDVTWLTDHFPRALFRPCRGSKC